MLGSEFAAALNGFLRFYGEFIPSNCHKLIFFSLICGCFLCARSLSGRSFHSQSTRSNRKASVTKFFKYLDLLGEAKRRQLLAHLILSFAHKAPSRYLSRNCCHFGRSP